MTDCQLCGEPVEGNGVDVLDMNRTSEYVPWDEHADRRICVKNIRADERERLLAQVARLDLLDIAGGGVRETTLVVRLDDVETLLGGESDE